MAEFNTEIVATVIEAGAAVAVSLMRALINNDHEFVGKVRDIVPDPLKSRLALLQGEARVKAVLERGDSDGDAS